MSDFMTSKSYQEYVVTKKPRNKAKYKNKKIEKDGVKFDSKLEQYCFNKFKTLNIPFTFQKKFLLQEKMPRNLGFLPVSMSLMELKKMDNDGILDIKPMRTISMVVDFYSILGGIHFVVDTKGFTTKDWILKKKMLEYQFEQNNTPLLVFTPHTQAQVNSVLYLVKSVLESE